MGAFGVISAACPKCNAELEFQTKETMHHLDAEDALYYWGGELPDGLLGSEATCSSCNYVARLALVSEPSIKAV